MEIVYPYHQSIRKKIKNGELLGFEFVESYPKIGQCVVFYFSNPPFARPVRPHAYHRYSDILEKHSEYKRQNEQ